MASTCLNNILEVNPEACAAIVENGGLERVGLKLLNNDMTESIINCLEKVSMEYSNVILASGVLEILMNVMDFLVIQSQVTILKIVSRIFKTFSDKEDDLEVKILPIIPKIKEVLQNSDRTEEVSIEIYLNLTKRIYKLYESDRDTLEKKINRVALNNNTVQFLISLTEKAIDQPDNKHQTTILNLFTIFNKFAFMSSDLSQEMLNLRIDKLVLKCLDGEIGGQGQAEVGKMIMNEIVSFINTLLSLNNYQNDFFQKIFGLAGIEILKHHNTDKKVKFIEDNADLLKDLLTKIVRDCTSIFEASDDFFFKYLFLTALRKIVIFLDADTLKSCTDTGAFANFISKTLDSTDIIVVVIALVIVQGVTTKLPDMRQDFSRHGIVSFLKQLSSADLRDYVVPEIYRRAQGSPLKEKHKIMNKDKDEFMQQLLSWQRNPKLFMDNLTKMKGGEKTEIREGQEEMDEEEGEEEMELATSPEASHKKIQKRPMDMEGMEEENLDETESNDKSEGIFAGIEENDLEMREDLLKNPALKETTSLGADLLGNQIESPEALTLDHNRKSLMLMENVRDINDNIDLLNDDPLASTIMMTKSTPVKKEKPISSKPIEYNIKQARDDLKKLASETLEKVGNDFGEKSEESLLLEDIRKSLAERDYQGLVKLAEFFKAKKNMTYYEFTQADFIKPLLSIFLSDNNSTEEIARFLTIYYKNFYKGDNFVAIQSLYENLLDFIGRLPEVTPFLSNDQLARSSFVQELRYLSTPLKIKVNFHQALARSLSKDDFLDELTQEFPHLDKNTKEGLYNDCVGTLRLFKEAFLKQPSVWLQVERFASLKSVEVYLIDKFTTKNLMAINEDFARKRQREADDKDLSKKGESIDSETILTNDYLQRKLEEQMNFGKEKDIRRYFEVKN